MNVSNVPKIRTYLVSSGVINICGNKQVYESDK